MTPHEAYWARRNSIANSFHPLKPQDIEKAEKEEKRVAEAKKTDTK